MQFPLIMVAFYKPFEPHRCILPLQIAEILQITEAACTGFCQFSNTSFFYHAWILYYPPFLKDLKIIFNKLLPDCPMALSFYPPNKLHLLLFHKRGPKHGHADQICVVLHLAAIRDTVQRHKKT